MKNKSCLSVVLSVNNKCHPEFISGSHPLSKQNKVEMLKQVQHDNESVCGFTLIELLVVVLIIGILAAVALPKYQLAVDKTRYAALMPVTKAIAEAQVRAMLAGNADPTFDTLDIELPAGCTGNNIKLSCNNGQWGCALNNGHVSTGIVYPRCIDLRIKAAYYYSISENGNQVKRICYAYATDDWANRLCQAVTGKKTPFVTEPIYGFDGSYESMKGYWFD